MTRRLKRLIAGIISGPERGLSMRRTGIALLSVLALAACGSPASTPTAPAPATPTTASAAPPADSGTGAAPTGAAPTAPSTTAPPATGGRTPRCHTADLKVTATPDPAGGAAGHHGEFLIFTNSSDHKCTLYGYPGVSFVAGDQGKQVGDAFSRSGGGAKTITLPAGKAAHATIQLVTTGVYDEADCRPEQVRGYRIYPPDETAAIFVSRPQTACSARGKGVGQVHAIAAGTADR